MAQAYVWPELKSPPRSAVAPEPAPEEVRQRAHEEGRAAGLAQGLEEGRRQAEAEVTAMRGQLADGLARLEALMSELRERELTALAEATLALCRNVLGWELRTSPEAFEELLAAALSRLDAAVEDVDVYLHPDDHGWLQSAYQGAATLHPDASVAPGGLSVRTAAQAADYDPQALLDPVFDSVRQDLRDVLAG